MATMKQVASRAGVSISTVSHVINKTRHVSDDVQDSVNKAIRTLNYFPSAVARSLKVAQTHTIGMVIPNNSNPFFAELIRGIEGVCFDKGYAVILCNTDDKPEKQAKYIQVLLEKRVDGLIVISSGYDPDLVRLLSSRRIPEVTIDRAIPGLVSDNVYVNHELGGYLATRHLLSLGHTQIACLSGPEELSSGNDRMAGYLRALKESQVTVNRSWLIRGEFSSQSGYECMQKLLALPDQPSAVFACNDLLAMGAMCAAHEQGIDIPDDLSIVGFDDIQLASYTCPPLTTMAQPKQEMGEMVANMLIKRMQNKDLPIQQQVFQPELRIRKSTAPPNPNINVQSP